MSLISHYLDIHLLPDPELAPHHLTEALFTKLHLALAAMDTDAIGVSFPGYAKSPVQLGDQLRLVGPADALALLLSTSWLGAMRDHIRLSAVLPVPAGVEHRHLRRVQAKSSPARLRRRQIKRHGLSEAEALAQVPDSAAERLRLPFVQVRSASTGQTFRLFLDLGPAQPSSSEGSFNAYGLSSTRTIPWF